jgi:mannosyltransferase OCH1-like enzyme
MIITINDCYINNLVPKYIVIDNQDIRTLNVTDKNNNKIIIPSNDKVIGNFDKYQILDIECDNIYCKQIGFVIYISNVLNPSWDNNFFLACGGINSLINPKNMTTLILTDSLTKSLQNIDFIINTIELHYKYFYPKNQIVNIPLIPQIIHMIWLKTNRNKFNKGYIENWAKFHPDFIIYLWTDFTNINNLPDNVVIQNPEKIDFKYKNIIKLYNTTQIIGIKSDILRYFILYKYGGIYVDINDFECFRSLETLTYQYEFVVGAETCYADKNDCILINNAFIACKPGHLILKRVIEYINIPRDIIHKEVDDVVCETSGPILFRQIVLGYFIDPTVINKTKDIILPSVYLYPSCFYDLNTNRHINSFKEEKDKWLHNVSFCSHYSDHSYL